MAALHSAPALLRTGSWSIATISHTAPGNAAALLPLRPICLAPAIVRNLRTGDVQGNGFTHRNVPPPRVRATLLKFSQVEYDMPRPAKISDGPDD
jgi:hypothetical protein